MGVVCSESNNDKRVKQGDSSMQDIVRDGVA
jgi:hypothetical protein